MLTLASTRSSSAYEYRYVYSCEVEYRSTQYSRTVQPCEFDGFC
jgi:hypothetical protein